MNQFPAAPEYPIRTVSKFLENLWRYWQVKVHHWYQWHWQQILPPVLLITTANLPLVSTTPVAICYRYQWHQRQIMGTISVCWDLKWSWKKKCIYFPKVSKQNNSNFYDWRFFPFATRVNDTVGHLDLQISPRIFEKIRNSPNGILRDLGETDSWKKQEVENLVTQSHQALQRIKRGFSTFDCCRVKTCLRHYLWNTFPLIFYNMQKHWENSTNLCFTMDKVRGLRRVRYV